MKYIVLVLALSLVLMGQDCEPAPGTYCSGAAEGGTLNALVDGLDNMYSTIIGGDLSTDRRSTIYVYINGTGYCTGVILGPYTVLTAAHCNGTQGHTLYLERNDGNPIDVTGSLPHPDYAKWESDRDLEARNADLMLLFTDAVLPEPYPQAAYANSLSPICDGLIAQGWGQDEFPEEPPALRESRYMVTRENPKTLSTKQATWGGICFGDSGGPLYAQVHDQPGVHIAGITSTTASQDCLVASTHIKVSSFWNWIEANEKRPWL